MVSGYFVPLFALIASFMLVLAYFEVLGPFLTSHSPWLKPSPTQNNPDMFDTITIIVSLWEGALDWVRV